jgi:hypothetical protein
MAGMDWLDRLSPEQQEVANMVADKAIAMGIDPKLAVSLAKRESDFDPKATGKDEEIGVMQVLPSTGKMLGFSPEDLRDPSKNIDAGLKYLKQQLDRFKDPMEAAAAYNAGPGHAYFKDPQKNELPSSTMDYLADINKLGGFGGAREEEKKPEEKSKEPDKVDVSEEDFLSRLMEGVDKDRVAVDAIAALLGAGVGGGGGAIRSGAERMFGSGAPAMPGYSGATAGEKWARATGYGMGQGTVRDVSERFKAAQPQPIGSGKVTSSIKAVPGTVAPLSINAIPPQLPPAPRPSAGQQMGQRMMEAGAAASRLPGAIPAGALGGLGAAELGMQAIDRYKTDPVGSAIAGVGAAGSAASLLPFAPAKVIGGGLAMASPAALYLLDKMRQARQAPPEVPISSIVAP